MNCGSLAHFVHVSANCLHTSPRQRLQPFMLGATDAAETLVAEKTPFVPAEEKRGAVADENYPIRRLSFTAALTPGSQRRVHQDRARKGLLRCLAFAGLVLLLVLGLSRAAME